MGFVENPEDPSSWLLVARDKHLLLEKNTFSDTQGFLFREEPRTLIYVASHDFEKSSISQTILLRNSQHQCSSHRVTVLARRTRSGLCFRKSFTTSEWSFSAARCKGVCPDCKRRRGISSLRKILIISIRQCNEQSRTYATEYLKHQCLFSRSSKENKKKLRKVKLLTESLAFGLALIFSKVSQTFLCPDRAARCRGVRRFWRERERGKTLQLPKLRLLNSRWRFEVKDEVSFISWMVTKSELRIDNVFVWKQRLFATK